MQNTEHIVYMCSTIPQSHIFSGEKVSIIMAKSLQEQLLQAGLTDKNKIKKVRSDQRKQVKQQRKNKIDIVNESQRVAEKKKSEKAAKDRLLNRQQQDQIEQKAIAAQITQLIELNHQAMDEDGIAFNFNDADKVKTIYVTEAMRDHISQGRLAIVKQGDHYTVVPAKIAEKIRMRDETPIIVLNEQQQKETESDDPYADYQIPDDLIW